ncbi:GDSL esterase/lipase At4g10955-like [Ipomoea triloba]|uniref:GDSL esterase/lipase At4g10955-like n=1 Tax=Ipomoea triloba TaxID=35885 RepID=UPI00125CD5C1|nr:GDSL esterase/lipase At4g10955-like [Ipomoea triloba]
MASQRKSFNVAGPSHLTHVDWSNFSHRRSVAASLVKGVYIHEQDRQQCCHGGDGGGAVATSRWWESFGFQLKQELVDEKDKSIFGAVYELKSSSCQAQAQAQTQAYKPPKLVIAFRGTLIKKKRLVQDFRLDHRIIQRTLHKSDRVRDGLQAVHTAVSKVGAENVWLAGHSLGSSIALLVGRNMVKMGYCLETYLFNPPFVSVPTQIIKNPKLQEGIRLAHTAVKAGMAVAMSIVNKKIVEDNNEEFSLLSPWIPYLFINPSDPICAEYLEYFQHRERMVAAAGEIGRLAAQNSVRCMVANAMGKDCKPSHLIPSAYLTINLNGSPVSEWEAHKLSQWWHPDLKLDHKLYQL